MSYTITITKTLQKDLDNLPDDMQERVYTKIAQLSEDPRPDGVKKLKGYENEYRLRVGDYRIRFEIIDKDKVLVLLQCKHRRDVYRN